MSEDSTQHQDYNGLMVTSPDMSFAKMEALAATSPEMQSRYLPILDDAKAVTKLLPLILNGEPVQVEFILRQHPDLLFKKGQVTNKDGLTLYNVSPYQLLLFLCDADMLAKITPWIPTDDDSSRKLLQQDAEMERGGADLIKVDRDPILLSFDEITQCIDRSEADRYGQSITATYPLLKNKDGIFFYNNNVYYVNRDLEKRSVSVELINPTINTSQEQSELNQLRASMTIMENNSSRRSNDNEHRLIANTMQHKLERGGIQYERDGVRYCDTHDEFSLINTYRTYIRLSKEHCSDAELDAFWVSKIGGDQRKSPMWVRERLCEDRPFIPLPDFKETPFIRDTQFWNVVTHMDESILTSAPGVGLGFDYALFKAGARRPAALGGAAGGPWGAPPAAARLDFAAIRKLIQMGISDTVACRKKLIMQAETAIPDSNTILSRLT